jgi:hypothetical protein
MEYIAHISEDSCRKRIQTVLRHYLNCMKIIQEYKL